MALSRGNAEAMAGILAGSLVSAVVGYLLLRALLPRRAASLPGPGPIKR